jgi:hypothetical protein
MSLASGSRKKLRGYYGVPEQAIPQSQVAQYVLYLPSFSIHVAVSPSAFPRTYLALKINLLTSLFFSFNPFVFDVLNKTTPELGNGENHEIELPTYEQVVQ